MRKQELNAHKEVESPFDGLHPGIEHFPVSNRLHTDVLEEQFGLITPLVLRHDAKVREAHLLDPFKISRTFAITIFPESGIHSALKHVDDLIRAGGAIGKTFKVEGFEVRKNVLEVLIVELPKWLIDMFHTDSQFAKARISEFLAKNENGDIFVYGSVIEIYHPDFRSPDINEADRLQEAPTIESLLECGVSSGEIWNRIPSEEGYDRTDPRYLTAKKIAQRPIFLIKEQLFEILEGAN